MKPSHLLLHTPLNCVYFNAQSLKNKLNCLNALTTPQTLSLICITESWLDDSVPNTLIGGPNYQVYRKDRIGRGGGVCVLVHNDIQHNFHLPSNRFPDLEVLTIDLFIPSRHRIITVYRPPATDTPYTTLLSEFLRVQTDIADPVTVLGDFNFPLVDWNNFSFPDLQNCILSLGIV